MSKVLDCCASKSFAGLDVCVNEREKEEVGRDGEAGKGCGDKRYLYITSQSSMCECLSVCVCVSLSTRFA